MKKVLALLLVLALLPVSAFGAVYEFTSGEKEVRVIVICEDDALLEAPIATLMGAEDYLKTPDAQRCDEALIQAQSDTLYAIEKKVGSSRVKTRYTAVLNGFSMDVKECDIEKIRATRGVKSVSLAREMTFVDPALTTLPSRISADYFYNDLAYDGTGKIVAVIDNELDTNHEFFAPIEDGSEKYTKQTLGEKMSTLSLNVQTTVNRVYRSSKIPFAYDYNDNDTDLANPFAIHGTHVSGIAVGSRRTDSVTGNPMSGVAPNAQLMFMKVFSTNSASDDIVIAALDDAVKLGADVINMSLGSDGSISASAYSTSVTNALNAGISVCIAAGNAARAAESSNIIPSEIDYGIVGNPGNAPDAFCVASSDNAAYVEGVSIELDDATSIFAASSEDFTNLIDTVYSYEYVAYGKATDFAGKDLAGKIALIDRGECTFSDKSQNAAAAGAVGVIIINYDETYLVPTGITLPWGFVSHTTGEILKNAAVKTLKPTAVSKKVQTFPEAISSFSSYAYSSDLASIPAIAAPGNYVYSSIPDDRYTYYRGTSMATPAISGAYALMSQLADNAYPEYSGADKVRLIRNLMTSSANPAVGANGVYTSPRVQGSGILDLRAASTTPLILYGSDGYTRIQKGLIGTENTISLPFSVKNLSASDILLDDIDISVFTDDCTDGYISTTRALSAQSDAPHSVSVAAGEEKEIEFNITLDSAELSQNALTFTNGFYIDGYITLANADCKASIPFTAFWGDWYAQDAFAPSIFEKQSLTRASGFAYNNDRNYPHFAAVNSISGEIKGESFVAFNSQCPVYFAAYQNRLSRKAVFEVTDSDGNVVFSASKSLNGRGKFAFYPFDLAPLAALADGEYTLHITPTLWKDALSEHTRQYDYAFRIDNEKPRITDAHIENEDSSETLVISASDNFALCSARLTARNAEGKTVTDEKSLDGVNTFSFDITNLSDLSVEIYDYAQNVTLYEERPHDVEVNLKSAAVGNGKSRIVCTVKNIDDTSNYKACNVIATVYDANGKLVTASLCRSEAFLSQAEREMEFEFDFEMSGRFLFHAFFFDDNLKPVMTYAFN